MATVIVSAPLPGNAINRLREKDIRVVVGPSAYGMGEKGLLSALKQHPDTVALISLLSDRIGARVLASGPNLQLVANYAVGVDNIDLDALEHAGVVVSNTPGVLTDATADLTMALLLDACRHVSRGDRLVRAEMWEGWSPTLLLGQRVTGSTLGIIGLGRIGSAVAQRARGFGMSVLYHQRNRASEATERKLGAQKVPLDDLLRSADAVTLHCPLTEQTRGLIGRSQIASMKRGSVLINTARGACIDEQALLEALETGHLAAAGLDVYEGEPHVSRALLTSPHVTLAPHLGSADEPTRARMADMCVESILAVLDGNSPQHRVV